ncbi:MAG TPA: class I SAM-dependent methyltransferase [Clostridiales bacterium]|nr:MAG: Ribosomal RNA large subunit methyltransferase K [Firmicutes bacterium ADurb.Bin262]HQH63609.1 class I SAM-dependent methyltransferase [Clostridiales bacterium]HQK73806.1 class I SAM-dependent methyltransferase [Clostridiales bacterium]
MRVAPQWEDYELLDCSRGERLERWGGVVLIRPDPQVIWDTPRKHPLWLDAHARYERSSSGGGAWKFFKSVPQKWTVQYSDCVFRIGTMGFKHTGLFPEQASNWDLLRKTVSAAGRPVRVLNLFAYTGAATIACLKAGASVVHVDASKGMTAWAKENAALSGAAGFDVRWIVDDCAKFVQREINRGSRYDIIIMDPPSYGRGPNAEVWKLEDKLYELFSLCCRLMSGDPMMMIINSYTAGLSASTMAYIAASLAARRFGGSVSADELGLKVTSSALALPCGSSCVWSR